MAGEIRYRDAVPADDEAVSQLLARACPGQPALSAETIRWAVERADPERPYVNLVAVAGAAIVGAAFLRGAPSWPGLLLDVDVDPAYRRRGIGTRLMALVDDRGGDHGLSVAVRVQETDRLTRRFMEQHGFAERDRMFQSELDLTTFNPNAHAEALRAATGAGIRFGSMPEVDTPELRHRLHRLATDLDQDVPSTEALEPISYDDWVGAWLESPNSRPDLLVIGLDGDDPVAVSSIIVTPNGDAVNHMSGVAASHRGRGLGLAVKVEALRRAQAAGITTIRTDNHLRNTPMLAINRRLGYQRRPGWIEYARQPQQ